MAVRQRDLRNPESSIAIETRDEDGGGSVAQELEEPTRADTLEARIARARKAQPTTNERHCLDCYERGRDAAIKIIEG